MNVVCDDGYARFNVMACVNTELSQFPLEIPSNTKVPVTHSCTQLVNTFTQ